MGPLGAGRGAGRAIRGRPVPGRWRAPVLPGLLGTRHRRRTVLRGLWRRPRPIGRAGRGTCARGSRTCGRGLGSRGRAFGSAVLRGVRRRRRGRRLLHPVRGPRSQPARPLHRAARAMGGRRVRSRHPPQAKRGRGRAACWARAGSHAVLVVCDGVSSSTDSDVASLAAARAARDVLAVSDPEGRARPPPAWRRPQGARVGGRRGQRGRGRPHLSGPQPRVVHLRGRCGRRVAPRRGLGG